MRILALLCCAGLASAQGTGPKPKPEDYDVHAQASDAAIGAEFMVHSFSRGEQMYIAKDFLVVEVALYPPKDRTIDVHNAQFSLRVNGKKQLLQAQPSTVVAAALQHPEWEQSGPTIQMGGGIGNTGVVLGGPPRNTNPFPGSNPPGQSQPRRVPNPNDNAGGVDKAPPVRADELVVETALPEGSHRAAVSGFLYFPYRKKISSIKKLELLYEDAVLKLR